MKNNALLPDFTLLGIVSTLLGILVIFPIFLYLVVIDVDGGGSTGGAAQSSEVHSASFSTRVAKAREEIENPGPVDFVVEVSNASTDTNASNESVDATMIDPAAYDETTVNVGEANYLAVCASCHGTNLRGVSGLGKPLVNSDFIRSHTDEELLNFIIVGRDIWDPANTTGVQMPARGGNPGLTDQDIANIVAYIRVKDGYTGPILGSGGGEETVSAQPQEEQTSDVSSSDEPVVFTPIDTSGLAPTGGTSSQSTDDSSTSDTTENSSTSNIDGEALFNTLCATDASGTVCGFLQTIEDKERLRDLLINGSSPFDSSIPADVYVPARGGMLLFSDAQIDAIVNYLLGDEQAMPTNADEDIASEEETTRVLKIDRVGRDGETVFAALCGEDSTAQSGCEYLQSLVTEDFANYDKIVDLLKNGPSPFDRSLPENLVLPARGGALLLSDNEILNMVDYLFLEAGYGSTDVPQEEAVTSDHGAVLYLELCTVDASTQAMCDFLVELIKEGATRERIVDLLKNGSSPFDSSIPSDIYIPQRGGTLLFSDQDIEDLVDYLYTLAEEPAPETSAVPYHTQQRTEQNVSYIGRLQGSVVFPHRPIPDFTLPSTKGEDFTLSDYRGRTVLVYFGYMTCPDVCPMTMVDIRRAYLSLGEPEDKVVVVFITIDPERDTLDVMKRYVEGFNEDFIGLRPESEEQLQMLMNSFGVSRQIREVDSAVGYLVDHSATVFMLGPDGRLISQFPFGVSYTEIANDIGVLSDYIIPINDANIIAKYVSDVDPSREYRIVIPEGTGNLIRLGQDPGIIPLEINLTLGVQDILVIENHDDTDYLVGGIWVAPKETVAKQFYEEQTFVGLCTVTVGRDLVEIIVKAPEE